VTTPTDAQIEQWADEHHEKETWDFGRKNPKRKNFTAGYKLAMKHGALAKSDKFLLEKCREKLSLYRDNTDGKYLGGRENTIQKSLINQRLNNEQS